MELPPGELANLIYENYWNYIKQSYIIVGDDRETCQLYKISSKVARHNYDLERFQMDDDGYMRYSDDNIKKAKLGIDVSGHQGTIDWDQVKEAGIQFAMIRLGYRGYTQGGLALDDNYVTNIETALESKMPVGVYFYTQAVSYEEGVEEAQYVLKNIADYKISYPVVIDTEKMEADGARANDISNEERTDAIVGFCDTIKDAGYTPMIYANRNWYAQNLDIYMRVYNLVSKDIEDRIHDLGDVERTEVDTKRVILSTFGQEETILPSRPRLLLTELHST